MWRITPRVKKESAHYLGHETIAQATGLALSAIIAFTGAADDTESL